MGGNYTLRKTYVDNEVLNATDYNADHQQHIDNQTPTGTDDYSSDVTQYRTVTDSGDENSEVLPTSLAGELERIRYVLKHIKSTLSASIVAQWYSKSYSVVVPDGSVTATKLANGATFLQSIRESSTNTSVGGSTAEIVMVTRAITLARSRVRLTAVVELLVLHGVGANTTFTIRIKRGTTTVASTVVYSPVDPSVEAMVTGAIHVVDVPGAGSYTYTVTVQANNTVSISTVNATALTLEEIV